MKFKSADAARAALCESLGWLTDVEWLVTNAIDSFFGPTGSFACFDQRESDDFLQCVLPWIYRVKSTESDALQTADPPDASHKISFANALISEAHGFGAEEAAEALLMSFQQIEAAMRPENRYQYFVGNLLKSQGELEAEFDLVQKILTDEVYLWRYLEVLFLGSGSYSFATIASFVNLFKRLDGAFQSLFADVYLGGSPTPKARELARVANAIQSVVNSSDSIDNSSTLFGDSASMKVFSVDEAAAEVKASPELLVVYASKCQFEAPFSAREVISIKRYVHRLAKHQKKSNDENAAKPPSEHGLLVSDPNCAAQARESFGCESLRNADAMQPQDARLDSPRSLQEAQALSGGWKLIGKLALGAAVVVAGALAASALMRNDEEEAPGEYFLLPSNFAGLLPDGTHTYWGSRGGRYYRTEAGRKVYV
jgi:hypothetical protein